MKIKAPDKFIYWAILQKYLISCQWLSQLGCVAGANKVEGTLSWCLGTDEILASK